MATLPAVLERLDRHCAPDTAMVVVDNGSTDGTGRHLERIRASAAHRIELIVNATNRGYSEAANQALARVPADAPAILLNPDVLVGPHWDVRLAAHMADTEQVGAVGPLGSLIGGPQEYGLYGAAPFASPQGTQELDQFVERLYQACRGHFRTVKFLIGCCLLITPAARSAVGGLDASMLLGADDFDWSLRARLAGFDLLVAEDVFVEHRKGTSTRQAGALASEWEQLSWQRFTERWATLVGQIGWPRLFEDEVELDRPRYRRIVHRPARP